PAAGAGAVGQRHLAVLGLLVSMAFLNRPDSVLLYAPALALAIHRARQLPFGRLAAALGVAALPALLGLLFSLVYYGFPAAHTAYAKALATGFPLAWRLQRGLDYLLNSLSWDPASHALVLALACLALRRRSPAVVAMLLGILCYLAFVVILGASA